MMNPSEGALPRVTFKLVMVRGGRVGKSAFTIQFIQVEPGGRRGPARGECPGLGWQGQAVLGALRTVWRQHKRWREE